MAPAKSSVSSASPFDVDFFTAPALVAGTSTAVGDTDFFAPASRDRDTSAETPAADGASGATVSFADFSFFDVKPSSSVAENVITKVEDVKRPAAEDGDKMPR